MKEPEFLAVVCSVCTCAAPAMKVGRFVSSPDAYYTDGTSFICHSCIKSDAGQAMVSGEGKYPISDAAGEI